MNITSLVGPVVASCGCELWDVNLAGVPGRRILKVFIEAPGGVDIERCARVSRTLAAALEEAGVSLDDLQIEVSSPGAERPLRGMDDYRRYVGSRVHVRYRSGESDTVVEGNLVAVDDLVLTVEGEGERVHEVPVGAILRARLAVAFGSSRPVRRGR